MSKKIEKLNNFNAITIHYEREIKKQRNLSRKADKIVLQKIFIRNNNFNI